MKDKKLKMLIVPPTLHLNDTHDLIRRPVKMDLIVAGDDAVAVGEAHLM